jgi:hypothetical protein
MARRIGVFQVLRGEDGKRIVMSGCLNYRFARILPELISRTDDRIGASSPIRRAVTDRLQSAENGHSRDCNGARRFDPLPTFAPGCFAGRWLSVHDARQQSCTGLSSSLILGDIPARPTVSIRTARNGQRARDIVSRPFGSGRVTMGQPASVCGPQPWQTWAVFLHPAQRRLVERDYNGPARISGSAAKGKTIVALHRAVALARRHGGVRRARSHRECGARGREVIG